jgi:hypothetical protein
MNVLDWRDLPDGQTATRFPENSPFAFLFHGS